MRDMSYRLTSRTGYIARPSGPVWVYRLDGAYEGRWRESEQFGLFEQLNLSIFINCAACDSCDAPSVVHTDGLRDI